MTPSERHTGTRETMPMHMWVDAVLTMARVSRERAAATMTDLHIAYRMGEPVWMAADALKFWDRERAVHGGDFTRLRRGSSNRAGTRSTTKTRKSPLTAPASYQVYADGSEIWSGTSRRDAENAFDEYAHDNYEGKRYVDAEIVLQRGSKTVRSFGPTHSHPRYFHRGANRAGSKNAKRTSPLTAATRVATLASLGVVHDSSLFYSVKGGKLYARARTGGGGYGRGRLGKAKLLGTIPGFKKGVFYSVSNGVISVRKRK